MLVSESFESLLSIILIEPTFKQQYYDSSYPLAGSIMTDLTVGAVVRYSYLGCISIVMDFIYCYRVRVRVFG